MSKPLTFNLKQHTPMLHFQASQQGATLRASDVKPRFDRWLIDQKLKWDFEKCKKYLIGYPGDPEEKGLSEKVKSERKRAISLLKKKFESGFRALNYKMRISICSDNKDVLNGVPMYFARNAEPIFNQDALKLEIIPLCQFNELKEENLREFFNTFNFGTRSSKGYGSFTDSNDIKGIIDEFKNEKKYYYFTFKGKDVNDVFKRIELLYRAMRSGINDDDMYFKSLMYVYAQKKNDAWDKKTIKDYFLNNKASDNGKDYRDCLGFSSYQSWSYYGVSHSRQFTVGETNANKPVYYNRYPSTILFKPIFNEGIWYVFIIPQKLNETYSKAEVKVSIRSLTDREAKKNEKYRKLREDYINDKLLDDNKDVIKNAAIKLKMDPEFSVQNYLDFIFKSDDVKISELFSKEHPDTKKKYDLQTPRAVLLSEVIADIRNNKK